MLQENDLRSQTSRIAAIGPMLGRGDEAASIEAKRLALLDRLAFVVVAAFRGHGHISNVLTHISGGDWTKVEQALHNILDPHESARTLSPLARNILDLLCADRGVTGRIMRPYFHALLGAVLEPDIAAWFSGHVTILFEQLEPKLHEPAGAAATHLP